MNIDVNVLRTIQRIGLTRLVHFTSGRNLSKILFDGALRGHGDLQQDSPGSLAPTDSQRRDGHPDKICCSFQFPNAYYLDKAVSKPEQLNYAGWVCLLIDAKVAAFPGALFSPFNAATGNGKHLAEGTVALEACFAPQVRNWKRGPHHHPLAPTDLQAEVLIPGPIPLSHVNGIVVETEDKAAAEYTSLRFTKDAERASDINWFVSPDFFDKESLKVSIHYNRPIAVQPWIPAGRAT